MLEAVTWRKGGRAGRAGTLVHNSYGLPGVFRTRMRQLQAVHHWLGGYFEAVGIMLQIPGAAEYEWLSEDGDDAGDFVWTADRDVLLSILAEVLDRLDAGALIHQVPGAETYKARKLPVELRLTLAARDDNGLMNIVAECLDRLMVIPELGEEERSLYGDLEPRPGVWRRCGRAAVACLARFIRRRRQAPGGTRGGGEAESRQGHTAPGGAYQADG